MSLADKVKKICKEKDITLIELAKMANIKQSTLYSIADGTTTNPRLDTIVKLAKIADLSVDELINDEPSAKITTAIEKIKTLNPSDQENLLKFIHVTTNSLLLK